jgi:hypothetical protein
MRRACAVLSIALAVCVCVPVAAQTQAPATARPSAAQAVQAPVAPPVPPGQRTMTVPDDRDADQIRHEFHRVLERHPPSLGRVLKLDPSLMQSAEYTAAYPVLASFLAQYPEVARNPAFFLSQIRIEPEDRPLDSRAQTLRFWENLFEGIAVFVVMATIISALMWLIKTLIDYRRWSRLSRLQQDVHTKILDRFTSNEDLLSYMRTTPGQRFLESAPIALDGSEARAVAAPIRRILWSVQAGVVLLSIGLGLQFVAGRVPDEMSGAMSALGVLGIAVGLGFGVSALVAVILTRRLGLLSDHAPAVQEQAPRA